MNCPVKNEQNAALLLDYCHRKLDPAAAAVLEEHMESCPACAAFRDGQRAVWSALDEWEAMPIAPDFNRRLYQRIESEGARHWGLRLVDSFRPMFLRPALPIAAACVVMVAGFLIDQSGPGGTAATPPLAPQAMVETSEADQVERTLDDLEMLREFNLAGKTSQRQGKSL